LADTGPLVTGITKVVATFWPYDEVVVATKLEDEDNVCGAPGRSGFGVVVDGHHVTGGVARGPRAH
jgi:hypothetical protein